MSDTLYAWVTGASRGIGRAIAERLVKEGYCVIGTATSDQGAQSIGEYLNAQPSEYKGQHQGVVLNVSDSQQTDQAISSLLSEYGAPDVLVNNAGITRDQLLLRLSEADFQAVINTNLTGVFRVCKAALKLMLKRRSGRIINISSIVGATGNAGQSNYAAAKAGLEGFSRSLAQEVASRNITVNCIAPGMIQTDMTDHLPETQKESILATISMQRFGQTAEIAGVVAFLAGEDASYITGQTIHVNGGMNMG